MLARPSARHVAGSVSPIEMRRCSSDHHVRPRDGSAQASSESSDRSQPPSACRTTLELDGAVGIASLRLGSVSGCPEVRAVGRQVAHDRQPEGRGMGVVVVEGQRRRARRRPGQRPVGAGDGDTQPMTGGHDGAADLERHLDALDATRDSWPRPSRGRRAG